MAKKLLKKKFTCSVLYFFRNIFRFGLFSKGFYCLLFNVLFLRSFHRTSCIILYLVLFVNTFFDIFLFFYFGQNKKLVMVLFRLILLCIIITNSLVIFYYFVCCKVLIYNSIFIFLCQYFFSIFFTFFYGKFWHKIYNIICSKIILTSLFIYVNTFFNIFKFLLIHLW